MSDPLNAPCRKDYFPAFRTGGERPESVIKWIVIHETESEPRGDTTADTAGAVARYFNGNSAQGSAHLVVDNDQCQRCLQNTDIPWGAPGANTMGFHIEHCGRASWSNTVWRVKNQRMLRRSAYKAAKFSLRWDIPPVMRTPDAVRRGESGFMPHYVATEVFGGTHTCPGPNFPLRFYMMLVRYYRRQLEKG